MKLPFVFFFIFTVVLITSVIAVQPTVNIPASDWGIQIEHPINSQFQTNRGHTFHFHLYNYNNSLPYLNNSGVKCTFHLYNSSGLDIFEIAQVPTDSIYDWSAQVPGNYFNKVGQYSYVFQCNNSIEGGFYTHDFEVTSSGTNGTMFFIILIYALAIVFFVTTLFVDEEFFVYISGVLFIVAGIFVMINGLDSINDWYTRAIAYVSLGLGFLFTVGAYIFNKYYKYSDNDTEFE